MGHMATFTKAERNGFTIHFRTTPKYFCCESPFVWSHKSLRFVITITHTLGQHQTTTLEHNNESNICGTVGAPYFVEADTYGDYLESSCLESSTGTLHPQGGASRKEWDIVDHRERRIDNA
jgi:hypothetical protein